MPAKKVMVTGVWGLIGGEIYRHLQKTPERYEAYGLSRRPQPSERVRPDRVLEIPEGKFVHSDLSDLNQVTRALQGTDVVVHMAADPSGERGWESVLHSNIIGTYNIFEGSRLAGVKRVICASSVQVSSGYRKEEPYSRVTKSPGQGLPPDVAPVSHTWPTRPTNIYACSKIWGEALARAYSDTHGLSCICLRIGWVLAEDRPPRPESNDIWCSQRDIVQLAQRCIDARDSLRFDIFYGMSDNRGRWVDISHARDAVGYVPRDRAEDQG